MATISDRIFLRKNIKKDNSLNASFSSNNSYYEHLDDDSKRDIIFLLKSGYDKRTIIKLYILQRPSNANEAIHYLTRQNGLFQHIFYSSTKNNDVCEICGESKNVHISENNKAINNFTHNSTISFLPIKTEIIMVQRKEEIKFKFQICEEILDKNLISQCQHCHYYFCNECIYLYIKELIKNGKTELSCPQCNNSYNREKIEDIFSKSDENKNEIENLKQQLDKNITKKKIISNPNLMFCPIIDCQGYAKKNIDNNCNIYNKGHKFCSKCGEFWHNNEKCPEE